MVEETVVEEVPKGVKKLEKIGKQQRTTGTSFIEKNIELAKCGRGVLSLTKEEESRVQSILMDSDKKSAVKSSVEVNGFPEDYTDPYSEISALDDDSKSILNEIDGKLQALAKFRSVEECPSKLSLIKLEEDASKENICCDVDAVKLKKRNKKNRLLEINKLLAYINSVSCEEINPLSQEEINCLLEQARQSLDLTETSENDSKILNSDIIAELVSNAKTLMPKFKYKYDDV